MTRRLEDQFANDVRAALDQRRLVGIWPLLALTGLLLFGAWYWAANAVLEEATIGDGRVIPSSQTQIVESLEGGLVADIFVSEGDVVEAGEPLVRIDDTSFAALLGELRQKREAVHLKSKRLEAEALGQPLSLPDGAPGNVLVQGERALFDARASALQQELTVIEQQLAQRKLEKAELKTRLERSKASTALLEKELQKATDLSKLGAYPEMDLLRLEREAQDERLEIAVLEASLPRAEAAIEEAVARKTSARAGFQAKAHEDLTTALAELSVLDQSLLAAKDRVQRTTLRAPVRGIVNKLNIATVGAVIGSGETLAEIIPLDDSLLIESRIRPQDVAFLYPGQDARVRVTAYDYTIYGDLIGQVERISADTITDETGETYYRVILRTDKTHLGTEDDPLPIIPGMVVSSAILTGEKTVLDYLLKPIKKARSEALRER